ncbi:hypothetical protein KC322_g109 [Hortaea werneckii]|nr:hypothetical protein KC322_g109 [Hortaea werneckii]
MLADRTYCKDLLQLHRAAIRSLPSCFRKNAETTASEPILAWRECRLRYPKQARTSFGESYFHCKEQDARESADRATSQNGMIHDAGGLSTCCYAGTINGFKGGCARLSFTSVYHFVTLLKQRNTPTLSSATRSRRKSRKATKAANRANVRKNGRPRRDPVTRSKRMVPRSDEKKQEESKEGKQFVGNTGKAKEARQEANEEESEQYEKKKSREQRQKASEGQNGKHENEKNDDAELEDDDDDVPDAAEKDEEEAYEDDGEADQDGDEEEDDAVPDDEEEDKADGEAAAEDDGEEAKTEVYRSRQCAAWPEDYLEGESNGIDCGSMVSELT